VEAADIINFAGISSDWNPLHTDEEYAKKIFGGRIAHGLLVLAIASGLTARGGSLRDIEDTIIAFLGISSLKFINPTRIGDTIHLEEEITAKKETKSPERGVVTCKWTVRNQRGESCMEADASSLIRRK
jgi:acyl dehydratase